VATNSNKSDEVSTQETGDDKILKEAHARFTLAEEAESEIRRASLDDLEFSAGKQWPENIKYERERDGRPCLVINKIPQFIQQITNDQRQNRPAIKVYPVDDQADIDTAKIIQGLVRHIEYNSNAEAAYDTAFESAVRGGFGYFRIITQYVDPKSFDQEILIKRIRNPFSVFFDPYAHEPDGSDANFAFVTEDLSHEAYKALYPNSKLMSQGEWEATGNNSPAWMPGGSARVAEYFYKENKEEVIVLLNNGQTILKSQLPEVMPEGIEVLKERTTQIPKICWVKLNACEILEKTEWLGIYIPIVPVYGSELDINGVRSLEGIVRNSKDPARMYNYWTSAETEAIALAPRTPFIAAEGQLEGYEKDWETANRRNHSVLIYKPTDIKGTAVPPPQRNAFEPAVQAITQARMMASEDIKATTGIYDASLGNRSNETSGVAIQRRNVQAQTSNFHFIDNLTRSLRHAGRILIDLIPKIYDTPRAARIVAEDGEQKVVKLNQPFEENGKRMLYALDAGKYDVTVDVGPSFQTKRQEAVASMLEMTKSVPQVMQVAGDLLVKNMDWPGAQDIAERLKKTLPPGLIDDPKAQAQQIPPQVQAQMQQMSQMVEQLTGKLHELNEEREQKLIEIESKERIEFKKLDTQVAIKLAELDAKDSHALLAHEIAQIQERLKTLNIGQPIEHEAEPEQQEYQNLNPQPDDGGQSAGHQEMDQQPTGGLPPGQPMQGNET